MHRVRVARAEADEVLGSEISRLCQRWTLRFLRSKYEFDCNELTLTWRNARTEIRVAKQPANVFNGSNSEVIPSPSTVISFTWQLSHTTVKSRELLSAAVGKKTTWKVPDSH